MATAPSAAAPSAPAEVGEHKRNIVTPEMLALVTGVDMKQGLSIAQVEAGLAKWGPNVLPGTPRSLILVFLSFLWGPMPIAICEHGCRCARA